MQTLPTLYKISSKGQTLQWAITIDGPSFFTEEGILNGKITKSAPTVCKPKNEGRANATTAKEQAEKEAGAKWQKKLDSGYFRTIKEAQKSEFFKPMLAEKFEDRLGEIEWPVYSSPKLDGMRCLAKKDGLFSRNGKPILTCPHILKALKPIFDKNLNIILDGELYNHEFRDNFNKIISLVKRPKPTQDDFVKSAEFIEFWVFDVFSPDLSDFRERYSWFVGKLQNIKYVKTLVHWVAKDKKELDDKYEEYLKEGYEGQMIRWGGVDYENKRSKYLLKRKEFIDEEFKIIDIVEGDGNRAGTAGHAFIQLRDGRTCKTNIKGDFEFLAKMLKDKKKIIGKMGTVKFFAYTPDGVPRFPYLIGVRDYE